MPPQTWLTVGRRSLSYITNIQYQVTSISLNNQNIESIKHFQSNYIIQSRIQTIQSHTHKAFECVECYLHLQRNILQFEGNQTPATPYFEHFQRHALWHFHCNIGSIQESGNSKIDPWTWTDGQGTRAFSLFSGGKFRAGRKLEEGGEDEATPPLWPWSFTQSRFSLVF